MSAPPATAQTPREFARLPRVRALIYAIALRIIALTGVWKYPIRANGDFAEMKLRDILYWLHKAEHHVVHPPRGSNLQSYFDQQPDVDWSLPERFEIEHELSLAAVGDLMDHEYLPRSTGLYRHVGEEIFGADLPMANLECVVVDQSSETPRFDGASAPQLEIDPRSLDVLVGHEGSSYAFLSTAGNHSLDCGAPGVRSTAEALRSRGIAFHGTNETAEEARHARLVEKHGITVAVLSHTFGLNGYAPPPDRPWMVNRMRLNGSLDQLDFSLIDQQISHARSAGADFVIAQLHWGMEFEHYPRPRQLDVAHELAERGVDAIFGHHPHVIQPFEYYRTRRDPSRVVPIYYSLGNLTNPFLDPRLCRSLLARIDLAKGRTAEGRAITYVRRTRTDTIMQSVDMTTRRIELQMADRPSLRGGD
ncbi:MAG TPA: CapA family protein [Alkalispirochaeta sp.]|nr:CapA family protein [Alkalispirochaeta sp.]